MTQPARAQRWDGPVTALALSPLPVDEDQDEVAAALLAAITPEFAATIRRQRPSAGRAASTAVGCLQVASCEGGARGADLVEVERVVSAGAEMDLVERDRLGGGLGRPCPGCGSPTRYGLPHRVARVTTTRPGRLAVPAGAAQLHPRAESPNLTRRR